MFSWNIELRVIELLSEIELRGIDFFQEWKVLI